MITLLAAVLGALTGAFVTHTILFYLHEERAEEEASLAYERGWRECLEQIDKGALKGYQRS